MALTGITILAACTGKPRQQTEKTGKKPLATAISKPARSVPGIRNDQLNAVYQQYRQLTSALVDGNATEAKVAAAGIEIGSAKITGARTIAALASRMTMTGDIEQQRSLFASLSTQLISLLKKTGMESGELYIVHCPMASNDQGADWLTSTREIRNPYFGESMLTCGSIQETLK